MLLHTINSPADIKHLNCEQLSDLCKEIREYYIETIAKTGGHLGGGLGVVELTVALHHVFNAPHDRIIWDIGHQSHPHKILTGRMGKLHTLRQEGGLSGFAKRSESAYDHFGAGHSSTSLSAAFGMEVARILKNQKHHVAAVIGDGAMSAGMAYEALNNIGAANNKMIVILNDNQMSISPSVGALSKYLAKLTKHKDLSSISKKLAKKTGKNQEVNLLYSGVMDLFKKKGDATLFEDLGLNYLGPIDGHDVASLVAILENIKSNADQRPYLLHVVTQKGKGVFLHKGEDENFHAVGKFCSLTGKVSEPEVEHPSYSKIFSDALIAEAACDDKIIAITAAMESGTSLCAFKKQYPDRFFDVGIAEQHAVTFAAGLACENLKPFVAIYSTFLQRAYDQIVHDVAIQKLPVRFAIDRAGVVGADSPTHDGSFDIAFLSILPNFVVMAPSSSQELVDMVHLAAQYNEGPIAFRYPRDVCVHYSSRSIRHQLEIGRGRVVEQGNDLCILSFGMRLKEALEVSKRLREEFGRSITVVDARFTKPLDVNLVTKIAQNHKAIITLEEGSIGGFATQVNDLLIRNDLMKNLIVKNMFLPDVFFDHSSANKIYNEAGLGASGVMKVAKEVLGLYNIAEFSRKVFS